MAYEAQLEILEGGESLGDVRWEESPLRRLPTFLSLDEHAGVISGIPSTTGSFEFIIRVVSDSTGDVLSTNELFLNVRASNEYEAGSHLAIQTLTPLPVAALLEYYSISLRAANGNGELTWSSSDLPKGLLLDSQEGRLSGIPSETGHYCITVFVKDESTTPQEDSKIFSFTVLRNEELGLHISEESPRFIDEVIRRLECGEILFNPPTKMHLHEDRDVSLLVSLDRPIKQLRQHLFEATGIEEETIALAQEDVDTRVLERDVSDLRDAIVNAPLGQEPQFEGEVPPQYPPQSGEEVDRKIGEIASEIDSLAAKGVDVISLKAGLKEVKKLAVSGILLSDRVRLARRMKAELHGPGFEIDPISDLEQGVTASEITEWRWRVRAIRPQTQKLTLTLSAILSPSPRILRTFEKNISVEVSIVRQVKDFHAQHWEWIWGTVLLPIVAWMWKVRYARKKELQGTSLIEEIGGGSERVLSQPGPERQPPGLTESVPIGELDSVAATLDTRNLVFISYSRKDKKWLEELVTMLEPMVRSGAVSTWVDTQIKPGTKWYPQIQDAIASAKVAVLLVSADFLASPFVWQHELPALLRNAARDKIKVLWILIGHCQYDETDIVLYQAAHDPSTPLNTLPVPKRSAVWVEITDKIKDALNA